MSIPIDNPRRVAVPLRDYGKHAERYKFSKDYRAYLTARGWAVSKEGSDYLYADPPEGVRKPFRVVLEVPDREQVERLAAERHRAGREWVGLVGEHPSFYFPLERPVFQVGLTGLWAATVIYFPEGPDYTESDSFAPPPVQPALF